MPLLDLPTGPLDADLIVFDKDGVLLDFHRLWAEVTRLRVAALRELAGEQLEAEALTALLGLEPSGRVKPDGLLAGGSREDATLAAATALHQGGLAWPRARAIAFEAFARAEARLDFASSCRALPGVVPTLRALHASGWRLAIATTDLSSGALAFAQHAGIADLFGSLVGVERVARSKPAPDMFLLACEECGVSPTRAVMVGDGALDLHMGRAANAAATVGVLSGVGTQELLAACADWIVADVSALAP